MTDEMIGHCGYNCHLCAARSDDPAVRQRLVDGWRRIFGHEQYTADTVRRGQRPTRTISARDGCRSDGRLADTECQARPCAIERGVDSCALCEDFVCKKVGDLLGSALRPFSPGEVPLSGCARRVLVR